MKKLPISITMAFIALLMLVACSPQEQEPLVISAIPDQDPAVIETLNNAVANYLEEALGIPVEFRAAETYDITVDNFATGQSELVWFGGLTGVQASARVEGAQAIVQRDIDEKFQSVFIANISTGLEPFAGVEDLEQLQNYSFTFGSGSSTSGYLMPLHFLGQANLTSRSFNGPVNFSGSHDATIDLVQSGEYEAGVLNLQVWERRVAEGSVDLDTVNVLLVTPFYYDYHWLIHPNAIERYGADFPERVQAAFLNLDSNIPEQAEILQGYRAGQFIITANENYAAIRDIARELGLILD